jgi:hypothetical protein
MNPTRLKELGANFEHFRLVVWSQVTFAIPCIFGVIESGEILISHYSLIVLQTRLWGRRQLEICNQKSFKQQCSGSPTRRVCMYNTHICLKCVSKLLDQSIIASKIKLWKLSRLLVAECCTGHLFFYHHHHHVGYFWCGAKLLLFKHKLLQAPLPILSFKLQAMLHLCSLQ